MFKKTYEELKEKADFHDKRSVDYDNATAAERAYSRAFLYGDRRAFEGRSVDKEDFEKDAQAHYTMYEKKGYLSGCRNGRARRELMAAEKTKKSR
jgi:hypothetical protein